MSELTQIAPATYEMKKEGGMRVPGLIIASKELLEHEAMHQPLDQVRNVAHLPGIVGHSIAMPDIHWGYGFPIGGVAAMDVETGVISPGGVGYDINCGVRLAIAPLLFKGLKAQQKERLIEKLFHLIPSGVGHGHKHQRGLSDGDYQKIIQEGAKWSVDRGYGLADDLAHTESHGVIAGGSIDAISNHAKERGRKQLGTIGSGNHFVEVGEVGQILHGEIAEKWGVESGLTYILIHSGSRGFGHQVCQDTLHQFVQHGYDKGLPDKQLVAAPIKSAYGQRYFSAMAAAANYAFNNRQQILHAVREAFRELFSLRFEEVRLIYDVCHNIAKFEEHRVGAEMKKLCVHRKGATRAFGKGAKELTPLYRETGQPVLVPGDMGRASHLMVGLGNTLTFCSSCHGAGRARSRIKSRKAWQGVDLTTHMEKRGVRVIASSLRTVAEEMPDAYKDVDQVVEVVEKAGLAQRVARLKPHLVIKG